MASRALACLAPLQLMPGVLRPAAAPPLELAQPVVAIVEAAAPPLEVVAQEGLAVERVVAVGSASAEKMVKAKGLTGGPGTGLIGSWKEAGPSGGMRRGDARWP